MKFALDWTAKHTVLFKLTFQLIHYNTITSAMFCDSAHDLSWSAQSRQCFYAITNVVGDCVVFWVFVCLCVRARVLNKYCSHDILHICWQIDFNQTYTTEGICDKYECTKFCSHFSALFLHWSHKSTSWSDNAPLQALRSPWPRLNMALDTYVGSHVTSNKMI